MRKAKFKIGSVVVTQKTRKKPKSVQRRKKMEVLTGFYDLDRDAFEYTCRKRNGKQKTYREIKLKHYTA